MGLKYLIISTFLLFTSIKSFSQCEELIWADEFDGSNLDTTRWTAVIDNSGGGNAELQYYTDREENIKIVDGHLIITANEEEYLGRNYTSAKIVTEGKADWKYGRFETRMKLPVGQGMWPAFWMLPSESIYGGWPNSGEIDIMEMVGFAPETVWGTLHFGPPQQFVNGNYELEEGNLNDDFHIFTLEWTPDTINWFIDDILYSTKTAADVNQWHIFQERFFMIINLAVGGNWPGNPDETTVFPQTLEVDYVRIYSNTAELEISQEESVYPLAGNINFFVSDIPDAQFNWSVPDDATILSGQGTNTVNVNWGCNEGDISVEIQSACGTNVITHSVAYNDFSIVGDTVIYENEQNIEFETAGLYNTDFTWLVPDDAEIVSQDSNKVNVNWGCTEGEIMVEISNQCISEAVSLPVSFKFPSIQGPESVPENAENITYTIDELPGAIYLWTVPEGAEIISGEGTNNIVLNFGVNEGYVSAAVTNTCGTNTYNLPVSIGDAIVYCSFEGSILEFDGFADATFEVIENPFIEGINLSDHVGKSFKSMTGWAGIYADLNTFIDFSSNHVFSMKVRGPKTGTVLLKIEDKDVGSTFLEVEAQLTQADEWQELHFDFTGAESDKYNRITLFFDFMSEVENYFYFDDIRLSNFGSGTDYINTNTSNLDFIIAPNPAINQVELSLNRNVGNSSELLIYNSLGIQVFRKDLAGYSNKLKIDTKYWQPGVYIIKIRENKEFVQHKLFIR